MAVPPFLLQPAQQMPPVFVDPDKTKNATQSANCAVDFGRRNRYNKKEGGGDGCGSSAMSEEGRML